MRRYGKESIGEYLINHFKNIYHSTNPQFPLKLEGLIEPLILDKENDNLCRVPTTEETKVIVFEMHPLKAPGTEGFPGMFYRHY